MIAFFEILACVADSLIAVNFVSKANGKKLTDLKGLLFALVYFVVNAVCVFSRVQPEYILLADLVLLLVYSLVTASPKRFKTYVSPVCVIGIMGFLDYVVRTGSSLYMGVKYGEVMEKLLVPGLPRVYYLLALKLMSFLVLAFVLPIITRTTSFKFQDYFLMLLFPVTMFYTMFVMSGSILVYAKNGVNKVFFPAISALFVSFLGIYYIIYRLGKNNTEREKRILYEQMLRYEEKRYSDMEKVLERIGKIKHDLKHQLAVVKIKMSDKDYEGAERELDGLLDGVSAVGAIVKTDNKVVDYMVNTKLGVLPYSSVVVMGDLEELSSVDDMELSILLGNVIDNAIEAVKDLDNPRIELSFGHKDNYMNIVCKNSVAKSVLQSNPSLITTKNNKSGHGYGLKSVKEIVSKLNGDVSFYEEDGLFVVHIMLQTKE